jgi:hypothetical protein
MFFTPYHLTVIAFTWVSLVYRCVQNSDSRPTSDMSDLCNPPASEMLRCACGLITASVGRKLPLKKTNF